MTLTISDKPTESSSDVLTAAYILFILIFGAIMAYLLYQALVELGEEWLGQGGRGSGGASRQEKRRREREGRKER
ncbi:hypothetical protein NX059_004564 [Plenodomus lindquistii]|nr:hypothetical protein NX059_004564 [Plenodomus lindquistii]